VLTVRWMKRFTVLVTFGSVAVCVVTAAWGASLRVDEQVPKAVLAANHAVLRRVPVYPGAKFLVESTGALQDGDHSSDNYMTERLYQLPANASSQRVVAFYRVKLAALGWRMQPVARCDAFYRRGRTQNLEIISCSTRLYIRTQTKAP
jgi:hypothetical protein